MEIDGSTNTEGQDNRGETLDQRAPWAELQRANWLASVTPAMILSAWLIGAWIVVIYDGSRNWGFMEEIVLYLPLGASLLSFATWLAAWSWLGHASWRGAIIACTVGSLAMIMVVDPIFDLSANARGWPSVALLAVGLSLPFLLLRRRGWQIKAGDDSFHAPSFAKWWQFSLSEILILTTGVAALLGLVVKLDMPAGEIIVFLIATSVCAPGIVVICLSWKRMWLALLASVAIAAGFTAFIVFLFGQITLQTFGGAFAIGFLWITSAFLATLLASLGWLRAVGYRLSNKGDR